MTTQIVTGVASLDIECGLEEHNIAALPIVGIFRVIEAEM